MSLNRWTLLCALSSSTQPVFYHWLMDLQLKGAQQMIVWAAFTMKTEKTRISNCSSQCHTTQWKQGISTQVYFLNCEITFVPPLFYDISGSCWMLVLLMFVFQQCTKIQFLTENYLKKNFLSKEHQQIASGHWSAKPLLDGHAVTVDSHLHCVIGFTVIPHVVS